MSAQHTQHTQGRIRYDYENGYCGELIASNGTSVATFNDEPTAEDARRLTACWNACEGSDTAELESAPRYKAVMDGYREMKSQRDELQEAVLAMIDREDNDCMPAGWTLDRVREIARKLRRSSSDRAVRRQHDDAYLAHGAESTRTGRAT